jgi:hypothetical protein
VKALPRLLGELRALVEGPNIRKLAPKSIKGKVAMVDVPGHGKMWAEPPDTDDTFPPAIASFEFVDGWLVYHGRNGSLGVIVGTKPELERWTAEVGDWAKRAPEPDAPRDWTPADGGRSNIAKATKAAKRVDRGVRLQFMVDGTERVSGEHHMNGATVINAHIDQTDVVGGSKVHAGSKTAAHEAAHGMYSKDPKAGKAVTDALRQWGKKVSMYHSLAGDFEGTMEAVAWWALDPKGMKRKAPGLFDVIQAWLG